MQDGVQAVYVKVLTAFSKGAAVPQDVAATRALCVTVAKNNAQITGGIPPPRRESQEVT